MDEGFDLEIDVEINLRTFTGYLPSVFRNADSGFEYHFSKNIDPVNIAEDSELFFGKDVCASFVTYSDFRECACAMIASAV